MAEHLLTISYRDRSKRIIRVSTEFFTSVPLFDHKIGKMIEVTAREKALSIAESNGRDPYTIELLRDNQQFFTKVFEDNKPINERAFVVVKEKAQRKKDLRKKFKNVPNTHHYKFSGDGGGFWKQVLLAA